MAQGKQDALVEMVNKLKSDANAVGIPVLLTSNATSRLTINVPKAVASRIK